jgi:ribosomal protein S18 acetylase RimI-like enzyme
MEEAPSPALLSIWRFLRRNEPGGFIGAFEGERLAGYAIFTASVRAMQRRALLSGAWLGWALEFARGPGPLRPRVLLVRFANKLSFVRDRARFRQRGDAQLINLGVDPAAQNRGCGKLLVLAGLAYLRARGASECRLEVRPENLAAVRVYAATGWLEVGRTRDAQGEWLVMRALL